MFHLTSKWWFCKERCMANLLVFTEKVLYCAYQQSIIWGLSWMSVGVKFSIATCEHECFCYYHCFKVLGICNFVEKIFQFLQRDIANELGFRVAQIFEKNRSGCCHEIFVILSVLVHFRVCLCNFEKLRMIHETTSKRICFI